MPYDPSQVPPPDPGSVPTPQEEIDYAREREAHWSEQAVLALDNGCDDLWRYAMTNRDKWREWLARNAD